jgi:hypothetical protein
MPVASHTHAACAAMSRELFLRQCYFVVPMFFILIILNAVFIARERPTQDGHMPIIFRRASIPICALILTKLLIHYFLDAQSDFWEAFADICADGSTMLCYLIFSYSAYLTALNVIVATKLELSNSNTHARFRFMFAAGTIVLIASFIGSVLWRIIANKYLGLALFCAFLPLYCLMTVGVLLWCLLKLSAHLDELSQHSSGTDRRFENVRASVADFTRFSMLLISAFLITNIYTVYLLVWCLYSPDRPYFSAEPWDTFDISASFKLVGLVLATWYSRSKSVDTSANSEVAAAIAAMDASASASSQAAVTLIDAEFAAEEEAQRSLQWLRNASSVDGSRYESLNKFHDSKMSV